MNKKYILSLGILLASFFVIRSMDTEKPVKTRIVTLRNSTDIEEVTFHIHEGDWHDVWYMHLLPDGKPITVSIDVELPQKTLTFKTDWGTSRVIDVANDNLDRVEFADVETNGYELRID